MNNIYFEQKRMTHMVGRPSCRRFYPTIGDNCNLLSGYIGGGYCLFNPSAIDVLHVGKPPRNFVSWDEFFYDQFGYAESPTNQKPNYFTWDQIVDLANEGVFWNVSMTRTAGYVHPYHFYSPDVCIPCRFPHGTMFSRRGDLTNYEYYSDVPERGIVGVSHLRATLDRVYPKVNYLEHKNIDTYSMILSTWDEDHRKCIMACFDEPELGNHIDGKFRVHLHDVDFDDQFDAQFVCDDVVDGEPVRNCFYRVDNNGLRLGPFSITPQMIRLIRQHSADIGYYKPELADPLLEDVAVHPQKHIGIISHDATTYVLSRFVEYACRIMRSLLYDIEPGRSFLPLPMNYRMLCHPLFVKLYRLMYFIGVTSSIPDALFDTLCNIEDIAGNRPPRNLVLDTLIQYADFTFVSTPFEGFIPMPQLKEFDGPCHMPFDMGSAIMVPDFDYFKGQHRFTKLAFEVP